MPKRRVYMKKTKKILMMLIVAALCFALGINAFADFTFTDCPLFTIELPDGYEVTEKNDDGYTFSAPENGSFRDNLQVKYDSTLDASEVWGLEDDDDNGIRDLADEYTEAVHDSYAESGYPDAKVFTKDFGFSYSDNDWRCFVLELECELDDDVPTIYQRMVIYCGVENFYYLVFSTMSEDAFNDMDYYMFTLKPVEGEQGHGLLDDDYFDSDDYDYDYDFDSDDYDVGHKSSLSGIGIVFIILGVLFVGGIVAVIIVVVKKKNKKGATPVQGQQNFNQQPYAQQPAQQNFNQQPFAQQPAQQNFNQQPAQQSAQQNFNQQSAQQNFNQQPAQQNFNQQPAQQNPAMPQAQPAQQNFDNSGFDAGDTQVLGGSAFNDWNK